jgi:formylglycine-generating enzyme required for sulfatase activity
MKKLLLLLVAMTLVATALVSCSDDSTTEPTEAPPANKAPVITALGSDPTTVEIGATASLTCTATDADGDALSYAWSSTAGSIDGTGATVTWTAPNAVGSCAITCNVTDAEETASESVDVAVFETVIPGTMVLVAGGTFSMGDSYAEGSAEETPVHSVTVGDFMIGKVELTQSEWEEYMTAAVYDFGSGATHPVYYASWFEIILYCNYRSTDEGLTPCYTIAGSTVPSDWPAVPVYSSDGGFATWNAVVCNWSADGYRMPTEAEWEFAARGGADSTDDYRYSGGQTIESVAWFGDNAPAAVQPVGGKLPNQLGLYDMSGNLFECCWDWYADDYYTTCDDLGTVVDPTGADSGDMRVVKGGGWGGDAANCRVAGRFRDYPVSDFSHIGIRLVKKP